MTLRTLTTWIQKAIVVLVMMTVLGAAGGFAHPPTAHAQLSVFDSANFLENAKTAVESTISAAADVVTSLGVETLVTKEFILDELAFSLAQFTLRKMSNSIIDWINSGFEGSPAFITDIGGYIQDTIDEAAGDFIYGTELGFLCSPFELDIRLALSQSHFDRFDDARCTLTDIGGNIENFYSGTFEEGGWEGWFELIQPQNNIHGAYGLASAELGLRTRDAEFRQAIQIGVDEGFLSWEECTPVAGGDEQCTRRTPGNVISEHLSFELTKGERALLEADEINEIIGAFFSQLAVQAITGATGLLGLTDDGNYNGTGQSYLDLVEQEAVENTFGTETLFVSDAIAAESNYRGLQQGVIDRVNDLESLIAANQSCSSVPNNVASHISRHRDNAQNKVDQSNATIATLRSIDARYTATDDPEEQLNIYNEFATLQASGQIHSPVQTVAEEFEIDDIIEEINNEISRVSNLISSCNSGGGSGPPPRDPGN